MFNRTVPMQHLDVQPRALEIRRVVQEFARYLNIALRDPAHRAFSEGAVDAAPRCPTALQPAFREEDEPDPASKWVTQTKGPKRQNLECTFGIRGIHYEVR